MRSSSKPLRIVAVPGFGGAGADYAPLVERITDVDWELLTWPGCDGTPYVDHRLYQPDRLCTWLMSEVQPTDVVVGYSMGARLVYECLSRGMETRAVILVGAVPGIRSMEARESRKDADYALAISIQNMGAVEFAKQWSQHPLIRTQHRIESPHLERQRARRLRNNAKALSDALNFFGQGVVESKWASVRRRMVPALLITGHDDLKYTQLVGDFASEWPSAEHLILQGGHAVHLEAADEAASAIQAYLRRVLLLP